MAVCPLIQKECLKEGCEWWAGGINKCTIIALTVLLERVHDMSATAYQEYFFPPQE